MLKSEISEQNIRSAECTCPAFLGDVAAAAAICYRMDGILMSKMRFFAVYPESRTHFLSIEDKSGYSSKFGERTLLLPRRYNRLVESRVKEPFGDKRTGLTGGLITV
jgi:hypothetical protein